MPADTGHEVAENCLIPAGSPWMIRDMMSCMPEEPFKLEETDGSFTVKPDRRKRVPEPLPVRIIAVEDVTIPCAAGLETAMDDFYVSLLGFVRDTTPSHAIVYHADNVDLLVEVVEPPLQRETLRATLIEVPSLEVLEHQLIEREIEYTRIRSIFPGQRALNFQDPAGNYVEATEKRIIV